MARVSEAAASAEVDVQAALAWRDFMVSNYSDTEAAKWLADRGIARLRGRGRLAGAGAVEVDGVRYTAEHLVLANGADPVVPPVPGLRELAGVWGTNEATGMKAVPRRLVVLGGGAAGVELAQVVCRLGGEVALVEAAERVLARPLAPLGEALGEALRRDRIELMLGAKAIAAAREGEDFVLRLEDGRELHGDHLLVATGRRPRVEGIGLETVGIDADAHGISVDAHMRAAERPWAIGGVTGIWQLTHVGEYQGEVVASNILGEPREAHYEAVPRVTYTDPQAAAVGATEAEFSATARLSEIAKTATYTHAYAESNGFLTLLSDREHVTGAYGVGPGAGEWLQQATLAIRARVPLEVLRDTIQWLHPYRKDLPDALRHHPWRHLARLRAARPRPRHAQAQRDPGRGSPDPHACARQLLPKEHQQHLELAANYPKINVAYTQIATISTDDHRSGRALGGGRRLALPWLGQAGQVNRAATRGLLRRKADVEPIRCSRFGPTRSA
jgi:pyruvate/2-oxoglutarate dehydrogenase complex dihydrolipoamide dehydrogenase (E3) component